MTLYGGIKSKRVYACGIPPSEDNEELRLKKQRALMVILRDTNDFFGPRYWIDDEERWMMTKEETYYLNRIDYTAIQYPLEYSRCAVPNVCGHCHEPAVKHELAWLPRDDGYGGLYTLLVACCGTEEKRLAGRCYLNKYTRQQVRELDVLTENEWLYSERKTQ